MGKRQSTFSKHEKIVGFPKSYERTCKENELCVVIENEGSCEDTCVALELSATAFQDF